MSFLHPIVLWALPVVALPVIIHLINQRRYQTVQWGAMMFLLAANRMSRGYARVRQWLIMAFRMAAIAALLFAISRPLAGGWLGLSAGGRADTTIILLDRSPSMQQDGGGAGGDGSKLATGKRQLARALGTLGSNRWVLIESGTHRPRSIDSPEALATLPDAGPLSAAADLPGMLEAARDYVQANKTGRTEVWICSDLRRDDWDVDDARWRAVRESFLGFPQGVRFHLLAYPKPAPANLAVRVTGVRYQAAAKSDGNGNGNGTGTGDGAELLVSLSLARDGAGAEPVQGTESGAGAGAGAGTGTTSVPIHFEIDGARSELTVEMNGPRFALKDHRIPLERGRKRGWGKVSIPADANLADNEFYFAFDQPAPRRAVVTAEDPQAGQALRLAASIAPDPALACSAEVVAADQLSGVDWDSISLLLWQGTLPEGEAAEMVRGFIERGGRAFFFPPRAPGGAEFLGARWTAWAEPTPPQETAAVESWRGDQDLLANTLNGASVPIGQLQVRKWCKLAGDLTPLASLRGGDSLVARATTNAGGAYFCATTPAAADSSLATDGVALYIMVQRAQAAGSESLETTRQLAAGPPPPGLDATTNWTRLAGGDEAVSTEFSLHRGVYDSAGRLLAVNRPIGEDGAPVLDDDKVAGLFRGLDFARVDDQEGNVDSLIQEVWRLFLTAMILALLVEAVLCMPRPARAATTTAAGTGIGSVSVSGASS